MKDLLDALDASSLRDNVRKALTSKVRGGIAALSGGDERTLRALRGMIDAIRRRKADINFDVEAQVLALVQEVSDRLETGP